MIDPQAKPLFVLSFRQRDELAAVAVRGGWRPVAARRAAGAVRRFGASGAAVAVIDGRGAVEEGLTAARMLGEAIAADGRALLVLVSRNDAAVLPEFRAAGATHFLASPMREIELIEALRFAERYSERVSGGWVAETRQLEPLGWRYDHARRSLQLSPALASAVNLNETAELAALLRLLGPERAALSAALRRIAREGSAAFAHDLPGIGRVVEHIQRDKRTGRLHALIEPLGETPDASAAMREVFPRRSRSLAMLADELPAAMARGEIDVLFQPQVDCTSGMITGVEALARWRHPRLGEVGAEALMAAASRAGQGVTLSAHIHQCAMGVAAGWPKSLGHLKLSINVTADDLAEPGFVEALLARADNNGLARDRVMLEITESGLIESLDAAAATLRQVREAGCRVAIDDFGTGYSSLAYLNALPLDTLKLDKSMVQPVTRSSRDQIVVRGVIGMARSLGLSVIAEGVERREQLDWLSAQGCETYQGYLCSPPIDSAALAELVESGDVASSGTGADISQGIAGDAG